MGDGLGNTRAGPRVRGGSMRAATATTNTDDTNSRTNAKRIVFFIPLLKKNSLK